MQDTQKAVRQGRSERRGEAYDSVYRVLSRTRTPLADSFSILLEAGIHDDRHPRQ